MEKATERNNRTPRRITFLRQYFTILQQSFRNNEQKLCKIVLMFDGAITSNKVRISYNSLLLVSWSKSIQPSLKRSRQCARLQIHGLRFRPSFPTKRDHIALWRLIMKKCTSFSSSHYFAIIGESILIHLVPVNRFGGLSLPRCDPGACIPQGRVVNDLDFLSDVYPRAFSNPVHNES